MGRRPRSLNPKKSEFDTEMDLVPSIHRIEPICTTVNMQKLAVLREVYPSLDQEVLEDVLMAADYRVDVAAQLASDLVLERLMTSSGDELDGVQMELDEDDEEAWVELRSHIPDAQRWVLVQDDWEMVDVDTDHGRSFADVLRSTAHASIVTPYSSLHLSTKSISSASRTISPVAPTKSMDDSDDPNDVSSEELWTVKTFAQRRRRHSQKHR